MAGNGPIVYLYDGTLEGLMCCVFESISRKEVPAAIYDPPAFEFTLYPVRNIETDPEKSRRVYHSIRARISEEAQELVSCAFLSCDPERESLILRFLRLGYKCGASVTRMLQEDSVSRLQKAVRFLRNESHLLSGFLRFTECDGGLVSAISPKNRVLPLLLPHFAGRLPDETFMIHDTTHNQVLCYHPYEACILPAESVAFPPPGIREEMFRQLWRRFYQTIAIEGRYHPECRRNHCPQRYWRHMTEFSENPLGISAPETPRPQMQMAEKIMIPEKMI